MLHRPVTGAFAHCALTVLLMQTEMPTKMWKHCKNPQPSEFSGNPQSVENNFSEGLLNPGTEWGRYLWVGKEVGRWCDSPFAMGPVTRGCANTGSRAGACCLILPPGGTDKPVPLNILGVPCGTPVALNDNSFLKYIFTFQSLKLCEGCITAHQSVWGFCVCLFWQFFVVVVFVAWHWGSVLLASGGPLWQENLEGICEGKGCWRTLQGGGTHTWHSLTHVACWGVVAGTCCPPKHTWALAQSGLISTAGSPQNCRALLQWRMADRWPALRSAPWSLFPLGCTWSLREWATGMSCVCSPGVVRSFLLPSPAWPRATCRRMAVWAECVRTKAGTARRKLSLCLTGKKKKACVKRHVACLWTGLCSAGIMFA